jgi:hypothetical protein
LNTNGAGTPAPHDGYIAAVCAELAERDVIVLHVELGYTPLRRAAVHVGTDEDDLVDTPLRRAEDPLLRWNEEDGWILLVPTVQDDVVTRVPWHHGYTALPTPEAVGKWAAVVLARADLTISREDGPYRDRRDADADFEDALRRYAASEASEVAD